MIHYLKIVAAMMIWSTWGLMIRWISLPAVVVLFYTSMFASVTVPLVLKARGELDLSGVVSVWELFAGLALSSIVNNFSFFYALGHTSVSNAVFTHYTAPVFVAVLAPVLIAERLQRRTVYSLLLAIAGMTLIVLGGGRVSLGSEHAAGIIAGTVSGIAYALLIIVSRRLSQLMMHHKAVVLQLWITMVVTAPFALWGSYELDRRTTVLLAVTGIAHSTAAPLLYYSALRKVIAQHAAILGYIEPLSAVPLAFFFLAETPSVLTLTGGVLILFSGYIILHAVAQQRRLRISEK